VTRWVHYRLFGLAYAFAAPLSARYVQQYRRGMVVTFIAGRAGQPERERFLLVTLVALVFGRVWTRGPSAAV
jgi:hypothetical protein